MPLPTLNWKYVGAQVLTSGTALATNKAVYQLGTATKYADGSTRTPGTGSAWTWLPQLSGSDVVATFGAAPTVTPVGMRFIIAGDGATLPASMLGPDTSLAATGYVGMNRGAGAYTTWTAVQPFTTGFSGYWRGFGGAYTTAGNTMYMYESQEACCLLLVNGSGSVQIVLLGAMFDPLTATNVESDGRLYFIQTPGYAQTLAAGWLSASNSAGGAWGNHSVTANQSHCAYFNPGLTTVTTATRGMLMSNPTPGLSFNGDIIRVPFFAVNAAGAFVGQARSASIVRDFNAAAVVQMGATVQGYTNSAATTATNDTVLLEA
jgi:hypothetical protein